MNNLNEYKTADQKFEDQLKSLIADGKITQEMAEHVRKHKVLAKDLDKNFEESKNILESLKMGKLV